MMKRFAGSCVLAIAALGFAAADIHAPMTLTRSAPRSMRAFAHSSRSMRCRASRSASPPAASSISSIRRRREGDRRAGQCRHAVRDRLDQQDVHRDACRLRAGAGQAVAQRSSRQIHAGLARHRARQGKRDQSRDLYRRSAAAFAERDQDACRNGRLPRETEDQGHRLALCVSIPIRAPVSSGISPRSP